MPTHLTSSTLNPEESCSRKQGMLSSSVGEIPDSLVHFVRHPDGVHYYPIVDPNVRWSFTFR
jgi:hypothetical protein